MAHLTSATVSIALAISPTVATSQTLATAPSTTTSPGLFVRVMEKPAPATVAAVAAMGQPQAVELSAGESVRQRIEARCGTLDLAYVDAFLTENRPAHPALTADDLGAAAGGETFIFPFCLPSKLVPYVVRPGDSVGKIYSERNIPLDASGVQATLTAGVELINAELSALKAMGALLNAQALTERNRGFIASENARRFVAANPGIDPTSLQVGQKILIDAGSRSSLMPLRDGVSSAGAEAKLRLASQRDSLPKNAIQQGHPASLIDKVKKLDAGSCDMVPGKPWPFSIPDFKASLAANTAHRKNRAPEEVTVLVVDTGYSPLMKGRAIPEASLGFVRGYGSLAGKVQVGINVSDMDDNPEAPDALESFLHGSEVAATLLGGSWLEPERSNIPLPLITFASLAGFTNAIGFYLDPNGLGRAYDQAAASNIHIINASVSVDPPYQDFKKYLKDGSVLLITAAGNVPGPPQAFPNNALTWPGALGGNPQQASPGLVISVGAHNPKNEPLYFSRLGRQQVDLLAPGCLIPTFSVAADQVVAEVRSGTSYAAPIVSLVAAMLAAESLPNWAIKNRLIATVDVDGRLATSVWSSGRLNAPRALRAYEDYVAADRVTYDDDTIEKGPVELWGRLVARQEQVMLCGEQIDKSALRMLARSKRGAGAEGWMGWQDLSTAPTAITGISSCPVSEPVTGALKFELTNGRTATVLIEDVRMFAARSLN